VTQLIRDADDSGDIILLNPIQFSLTSTWSQSPSGKQSMIGGDSTELRKCLFEILTTHIPSFIRSMILAQHAMWSQD
jgi:hypothetical protein